MHEYSVSDSGSTEAVSCRHKHDASPSWLLDIRKNNEPSMQAKMRDLEKSSKSHYLFNCERRDFGERHFVCLLGRVLHVLQ